MALKRINKELTDLGRYVDSATFFQKRRSRLLLLALISREREARGRMHGGALPAWEG